MEKLKMGIRVFVLMLLMQVHVFATQVYEESENITDTESVVGQDLTEKNETNKTGQAAFNIHINVPDGFMDEIQLLFISQETEDEFECVLTQENQYAMSFLLMVAKHMILCTIIRVIKNMKLQKYQIIMSAVQKVYGM